MCLLWAVKYIFEQSGYAKYHHILPASTSGTLIQLWMRKTWGHNLIFMNIFVVAPFYASVGLPFPFHSASFRSHFWLAYCMKSCIIQAREKRRGSQEEGGHRRRMKSHKNILLCPQIRCVCDIDIVFERKDPGMPEKGNCYYSWYSISSHSKCMRHRNCSQFMLCKAVSINYDEMLLIHQQNCIFEWDENL